MSKTLPLVDHLLERARRFESLGLEIEARDVLERLCRFRDVPQEVAEETQHRLAGLLTSSGEYGQARSRLAAALAHQPNNPEYHAEMARVLRDDDTPNRERARMHFLTALRLDPDNARHRCELGLLELEMGNTNEGLDSLRQAHAAAPADHDVLDDVATALAGAGCGDEALGLVRTAMFSNSGDHRFRDLYRRHQYRQVAAEQSRREAIPFPAEEPVLLPFERPGDRKRRFTLDGEIFRIDEAHKHVGPRRHAPDANRKKRTR